MHSNISLESVIIKNGKSGLEVKLDAFDKAKIVKHVERRQDAKEMSTAQLIGKSVHCKIQHDLSIDILHAGMLLVYLLTDVTSDSLNNKNAEDYPELIQNILESMMNNQEEEGI